MASSTMIDVDRPLRRSVRVDARRRPTATTRRPTRLLTEMDILETRSLLSTIVGQVITDVNGNGLRDVGETGLPDATVALEQFDTGTGVATPIATKTTDAQGVYRFDGLAAGTYLVTEPAPTGVFQTMPSLEHAAASYLVQLGPDQDVAGGTLAASLAAPTDNWLASLPAQTYSFPLAGDFMMQLGPNGTAPTRVFLTGAAEVQTQAPIVSTGINGEGTATTDITVNATMISLHLVGTVSSDQHEQGYLGTITMTLTESSTGQLTSRSDSASLVDSSFDLNVTMQIPSAFGTPTELHSAVPINILSREIARFPAFGGTYAHKGTTTPISLVDSNSQEQGQLIFATLTPMPGLDFGNFVRATVQGQAYIKNSDGSTTPLVSQPIILQQVAEVAGPTSEGSGQGGGSGSAGPPDGQGPAPTTPITVYTDTTGAYSFTGLGPGSYTLEEPNGAPLTLEPANNLGLGTDLQTYTITTLESGSTSIYNFINTFATGQINQGTAPGYLVASQTIVPNLHLGYTEFANSTGAAYINDGVSLGSALTPGATVPITITVVVPQGQTGYLSGWLDANGHGTFAAGDGGSNHGDQIQLTNGETYSYLDNYEVGPGVTTLHFNMVVPSGLTLPTSGLLATYARFRLSDARNLGPANALGQAATPDGNGEVEDLPLTIYAPSQLGTINGQTFEDVNGNGAMDPGEPGQDGWTVNLVNLDNGQVVATRTSAAQDIDLGGGTIVSEAGIYQFAGVVPGRYEVQAIPPTTLPPGMTSVLVTAPSSDEGGASYRIDVTPGEVVGTAPYATTPASAGWLNDLAAGTDSVFTLGQFMIIQGTGAHAGTGSSGGSGGSGSSGGADTNQPIRISVVGYTDIYHGTIGTGGLLPAEITGLQLKGLAVTQATEGGPLTVLGQVTVTVGIFDSTGTIGPNASGSDGSGESSGDTANFSLYVSLDLTALGYGVMINTRPINISGSVLQMPMVDMVLSRSGGGSPIPLRDAANGTEPLRLVTASLTTMFGLDQGDFYPGSLGGTAYQDMNNNNVRDTSEAGLAGATVMVQQISTEGPTGEEGGEGGGSGGSGGGGGGGGGGSGQAGKGETTTPPVYLTQTDAQGQWSITDLGPGTYQVTEIPPHGYGVSGNPVTTYTVTVISRDQIVSLDFGNYPINQAPAIAAPSAAQTDEDSSLVFSSTTGIGLSVSDEDAGTGDVRVSLSVSDGTLSLTQSAGLTFVQGGPTGSGQIVATGTIDAINAALAGLMFVPTAHFNGAGSLTIGVDDLGNSGFGGPKTAATTIPIAVSGVADAPGLTVAPARGSDGNPIPLGIAVSRVNGANTEVLSVTVGGVPAGASLSAGTALGNGQWQLTPQQLAGLTLVSPNSGTYSLTVTATATEPSNVSTATTVSPLTVTVDNIIPQIYSSGDQTATVGDPTAINLGSFWDTATDGAWNVQVNWGDSTSSAFTQGATGALGSLPHAYVNSGRFVVTVTVQDKDGGTAADQFLVTVGPTEVAQVTIGDGTAQRSMITSVTVTFTGPVTVLPGTFTLRDRLGTAVKLNVSTTQVNGQTVATLTFGGRRIVGGSLWDGLYTLTIDGSRVLDATTGQAVDAAVSGLAGSSTQLKFRRRFGDINGDGVVNRLDMQQFRHAFRSQSRQVNYQPAFDYNSNGMVSTGDQLQIRQRLEEWLRIQDQIRRQDRLRSSR